MAESTPTSPRVALLLDLVRNLEGRILALEKENEELRAPMTELEAELEREMKATTAAPDEEESEAEGQRRASCRRMRVFAAATPDGRERVALRRERPSDGSPRPPGQFGRIQ
jgi:septal ring factor EnvC (AmiA/AmiB activator)